jgi:DNA polymerase-3 subunit epsilon
MHGGIEARAADTLLVDRARDFLAAGPADAATLVRHVCQLPTAHASVAEPMVVAMLGGRPEFAVGGDGRWTLASQLAAPAPAPTPTFEEWQRQRAEARRLETAPAESGAAPARRTRAVSRAGDELGPAAQRAPSARRPPTPVPHEPLAGLSYVVVDVETTGSRPDAGDRITEIAAVIVRDGRVQDVFETLVNPQRPIPPFITNLTNITWEMVKDKPTFAEIAPELVRFLTGHVFVAHNVGFDWRFVTSEVHRTTGQLLDGRRLCTVRMSRKLLPQLPRRTLGHVAHHYGAFDRAREYFDTHHGPGVEWRHRAAGDAVATAHCLLRLIADAGDRGCTTWHELDAMLSARTGAAKRRRPNPMPHSMDRDAGA